MTLAQLTAGLIVCAAFIGALILAAVVGITLLEVLEGLTIERKTNTMTPEGLERLAKAVAALPKLPCK